MDRKVIENQFRLLRILAAPLTAPWNRGDTRIWLAIMGLAFWIGFTFWWYVPLIVAFIVLASGVWYSKRAHEDWEESMMETLRQELIWNAENRNVLAQKYGAYYVGLPGDANDPEDWKEYEPGETWQGVSLLKGLDSAP